MASNLSIDRTPPSFYRRAFYVVTAFAGAYALSRLHAYYASSHRPSSRALRRRNAVRRRHSQRRGGISLPSGESYDSSSPATPILALSRREREGRAYGSFRVMVDDGRAIDCPLLPSQLASTYHIQREVGASFESAVLMRQMMEDAFLTNFLAVEFPPTHVIRQDTGEWEFLADELASQGISNSRISWAFNRFNEDSNFGEGLGNESQSAQGLTMVVNNNTISESAPEVAETSIDDQSVFSWRDGSNDASPPREGQNLLNLLYHIAEDQARRDGYIHRGVTCNSCGVMPIQGIRYRCANCLDFDLCESCEASQVHIKTHLFYKIRIPAPFLGNARHAQPVWYPGKPNLLEANLPRNLAKRLMKETNFENTELDALWDQFRCLANTEWINDPNKIHMAIDRKTFDKCFVPQTSVRPPPPSLIYDRMFAFYDTNGDNLIGFEEFLKGLASLSNKSMHERLKRIFDGYDIDRDGYVERKDFLRIFRAYYVLSRELTRDMVSGLEEDDYLENGYRGVVLGSQPISAAFGGAIPGAHPSRAGEGKRTNLQGDLEIIDNEGALREDGDETYDRQVVIEDAAVRQAFGRARPDFLHRIRMPMISLLDLRTTVFSDGVDIMNFSGIYNRNNSSGEYGRLNMGSSFIEDAEEWPPAEHVHPQDIITALGAYVPLDEVTDPVDMARVGTALLERIDMAAQHRIAHVRQEAAEDRWRRRDFYIDEEEGIAPPPGYSDDDGSHEDASEHGCEEESDSHVPSLRSRSSSKVRFQDDVTDNEYETRSNQSTSSRSIPVGERWGGFEIPEVEKDAGKEILYQVTQQGLNELLDLIFKPKEDLLVEVYRTREYRKKWAKEIDKFGPLKKRCSNAEGGHGADSGAGIEIDKLDPVPEPRDKSLGQLLDESGYAIDPELPAGAGPSVSHEYRTHRGQHGYAARHIGDSTQGHTAEPDLEFIPIGPESVVSDDGEEHESPTLRTSSPPPPQPPPDPTLPQNRPNEQDLEHLSGTPHINEISSTLNEPIANIIDSSPVYESASTSTSTSGRRRRSHSHTRRRNRSLPLRLRFQQTQHPSHIRSGSSSSTASSSSSCSAKKASLPSPPPSPKTLARWHRLNQVELEAKERGGSGAKLNFDEFAVRMQGERGKRLGFVGSWIDMTSF